MTETSRFWDGTATGDAVVAPYDASTEFSKVMASLSGANGVATNLGGVLRGELNELVATGVATPAAVASGRSVVWGTWYESDASINVAIPTPSGATRIDRLVLRKDWVAQTVRLTRIAGVEGGAAPALVQVAGTTWDEPIAQVSITTGGVITLTDQRVFIGRLLATTGSPSTSTPGDAASLGSSQFSSPLSHVHARADGYGAVGSVQPAGGAVAAGVSANIARVDHVHNIADQTLTSRMIGLTSATADVNTGQTTTSTSYTDLATVGPTITLSPGVTQKHLLIHRASASNSVSGSISFSSVSINGAAAADADRALCPFNGSTSVGAPILASAMPSGATHTMKYKVNSDTGTWLDRRLVGAAI